MAALQARVDELAERVLDLDAVIQCLVRERKHQEASEASWAGLGGHGPGRALQPVRHLAVVREVVR